MLINHSNIIAIVAEFGEKWFFLVSVYIPTSSSNWKKDFENLQSWLELINLAYPQGKNKCRRLNMILRVGFNQ